MPVNTTKLAMMAVVGAVAVFLGTIVLTLQVLIVQRKNQIKKIKSKRSNNKGKKIYVNEDRSGYGAGTITPSEPTEDIFLWKDSTPETTSKGHSANAYWSQVQRYLENLGDAPSGKRMSSGSSFPPSTSHVHESLLQAANLGHPTAQHYVATALSSGIWLSGKRNNDNTNTIPEDFFHINPQSMILWHMAALEGNVEAALSLGNKIRAGASSDADCSRYMPYYEAAANSIIDELEAEKHSRAKVNPPMDKHSLVQVHIHGGTSSQLNWENKPDESQEALQYYHLLSSKTPDPDVHASYTLAHLYHYGLRGVPQNLTKALFYYEIAAKNDYQEAAGQAGKFHIWSLGFEPSERNIFTAHKYFKKGTKSGLKECMQKYQDALKVKRKGETIEETSVDVCDHPSLNGFGLLHLYGVPMLVPVDFEKAKTYFQLARDMGNMDASYNLAMLKLGFRSSWKEVKDSWDGQSVSDTIPAFMEKPSNFATKEDWISAVRELESAASKGHLQAHHRLGMLYAEGIRYAGGGAFVNRDCKKAYAQYKWIVDNASPQLSRRTRTAYKQYTAGDFEGALVNYLMAAETGHKISQVNAAFLLDRGVCLHLSEEQCRGASLRLWKAAAQSGDAEAAIRVGDFYFYGSTRRTTWVDVVLFPEVHLVPATMKLFRSLQKYVTSMFTDNNDESSSSYEEEEVCKEKAEDGVCLTTVEEEDSDEDSYSTDLEKAAEYYRLASQQHKSPRANFNLGYMHQWGLGLTQDFPLAKRHYDLAGSAKQATFAAQLALLTMGLHEQFLSLKSLVTWSMEEEEYEEDEYEEDL